jgi:hypothetical protein
LQGATGQQTISSRRACILKQHQGVKVFLLLFLQKKKILFFSEEKNQKTFTSGAGSNIRDLAG